MKKITQSVMALSLVIPSAALIQTAEQVEAQVQKEVTAFSLNVRSGPGANHKVVDWLKKGQIVNVLKDGSDWDYVQFDNGKKGYVYDEYLKTIASGDETRSVTAYSLTVRTGPGANYQAIDWLKKGTNVKVISTSGDWVRINVNGKTGYVNGKYLTKGTTSSVTTPSTSTSKPSTSNSTDYRKVTASSLTVRTGPGVGYKATDWLQKNQTVQVLSVSGDWAKVSVSGKTGYVHTGYLTKTTVTQPSKPSTPATSTTEVREVTAYWLTMRDGASANNKAIGYLKKGTKVTVHSYKGDWANVTAEGKKGYVHSGYLSKGTTTTAPSTPAPAPTTPVVTGTTKYVNAPDGLNLRSGRGVQNRVVVTMPYGASVKVSDVVNGWGKITYGNHTGYANVGYLVNSKPSVSKPAPVTGNLSGKLIVLDPGHGGKFAGAQGIVSEEDVNLAIALKTRDKLQSMGAKVIMTRTTDTSCTNASYNADLQCRPALATKMGADAFVSIHANSGTSSAYGSETFYYNAGRGDQRLAANILDEINEEVGMRERRVAYANFAVLRHSTVPSTLVETGFVTNSNDAAKLGSAHYQDLFAKAIAEGIAKSL